MNSYPAAVTIEWISKRGIAIISKNRSRKTVIWKAIPRALGLIVLDISQRINSASTAASAIVVEKTIADKRVIVCGRPWFPAFPDC